MRKKALGRGLDALIPSAERDEPAPVEIDIDRITPNPMQPRLRMDEQRLEELAASVRENGVLQPILVRPHGSGYQLIAGERRLSAAQRAGLLRVPAVVREVPDERMLELALVENIQREQLNPIEEAQAYQALEEDLKLTQEALAGRVGKERSTVANALRLLKLPPAVKDLIAEGKLTPGHGRALLGAAASHADLSKAAQIMADKGWSVREAERWARTKEQKSQSRREPDPNEAAAEDRLRVALGTKVELHRSGGDRGHIKIHFYSAEDLDRIFGILTQHRP